MSEKLEQEKTSNVVYDDNDYNSEEALGPEPTEDDWKTLGEVADKLPASAYLVIIIEFCERFTYYGLSGPFQSKLMMNIISIYLGYLFLLHRLHSIPCSRIL